MQLVDAQRERRIRGEAALDAYADQRIDVLSLSLDSDHLGTADVSPAARKKLAPIIRSLAKDPHPFTKCMKNLRDEQPSWSEDRRKKTCNVLKALAGRQNGGSTKASLALSQGSACVMVDDEIASLLERVDEEVLAIRLTADEMGDDMAVITSKQRKSLPAQNFVFAGGRRYPIHDLAHARNALARSSGKPEEAAVKAAVYKKFPQLKPNAKGKAA